MTQLPILSKTNIKDRSAWRKRCLDLFFFEIAVCSQAFKDRFNDFGKLQMDMCDFLDWKKNPALDKYFSAFRGSYKTTVLMGLFAYFFAWNVALRKANSIAYYTAIKDNAYNFSNALRLLLLENDLLQWIFPELPTRENQFKELTKNTIAFKDVRMDFISMDTTQASKHSIFIVNDDLENEKNYRTEFSREELKKAFEMQRAVQTRIKSKNIGHHVYTCTPYHIQGLTWELRNKYPKQNRFEAPCYIDRNKENGSSFPERYTVDDFDDIQSSMSNVSWSSQYLLLPQAEEDMLCKENWLQYWEKADELPTLYWRTMVVDPGGADRGTSDATGITIVDSDEIGNMYVIHAGEYFVTPMEMINKIRQLQDQYKPHDCRIEKERTSVTIADMMKHKFPQMRVSYVEHHGESKGKVGKSTPSRIWKLRQWFESKSIYVNKATQKELIEQIFGRSKRDDVIDSLAYHVDIRRIPKRGAGLFLPSGKPFSPKIGDGFEEEMNKVMASVNNQEEARNNDRFY